LNHQDYRSEAHIHLRSLIEKIVLTPNHGQGDLSIDLYGNLAGILSIASQENPMKNKSLNEKRLRQIAAAGNHSSEPSVNLVAGAGCQRYLPLQILVTALNIAAKPLPRSALLSIFEGAHTSTGADYTSTLLQSTIGGR